MNGAYHAYPCRSFGKAAGYDLRLGHGGRIATQQSQVKCTLIQKEVERQCEQFRHAPSVKKFLRLGAPFLYHGW